MAVPIPGNGKRAHGVQADPAESGLRLEYAGKKPAGEILATPPGRYKTSDVYWLASSRHRRIQATL
jgi:hypothetical protein